MAVQQTQMLPPQYVEDLQKDLGTQLTALTTSPLDTSKFAPQVAAQDAAQTSAYNLATTQGQGIGAFQPYITQANQLANQAFGQQQALAQQVPQLYGADVGALRSAGADQQAQAQAGLDALREQNRLAAFEPYERLGYQQQGVASIASGMPGQYQSMVTPNPTPLQNALGIAGVAGGLMTGYGDYLRGSGQQ